MIGADLLAIVIGWALLTLCWKTKGRSSHTLHPTSRVLSLATYHGRPKQPR